MFQKSPLEVQAEIEAEKEASQNLEKQKELERQKEVVTEDVRPVGVQGGIPEDPEIKAKQTFIRNVRSFLCESVKIEFDL